MHVLIRNWVLCLLMVALPGWGQSDANPPRPIQPSPSVAEIAADYLNYERITKQPVYVNPELAMLCRGASKAEVDAVRGQFGPHAHTGIVVYMNDLAAAAFRMDAVRYPVGAVVVKQKAMLGYFDRDGQRVQRDNGVGGMIKRAPGFDPEHGDWEYFYFENLNKIESGSIASCVQCHDAAKDKDHVFGTWKK